MERTTHQKRQLVQGVKTNNMVSLDDSNIDFANTKNSKSHNVKFDDVTRSILKRRQIIDDNTKINSKRCHSPIPMLTPKKNDLNFVYCDDSEVDDNSICSHSYFNDSSAKEYSSSDISTLASDKHENLLLDDGNRRNLSFLSKSNNNENSFVYRQLLSNMSISKVESNTSNSESEMSMNTLENRAKLYKKARDDPFLGYDWIAGVLDNEEFSLDKNDDFFSKLQDFRKLNKSSFISTHKPSNLLDFVKPVKSSLKTEEHTCIHGFTVNDRLFTKPINPDLDGKSTCPVCLSTRSEPTSVDPNFIRVSIPRSTLTAPHRVKPHRRRSFDSTESMSLSSHCLAGYECAKPASVPTASTIDLKHATYGVGGKYLVNKSNPEKLIQSFKQQADNLQKMKTKKKDNSTLYREGRSQTSEELLHSAYNLYFDHQREKYLKERSIHQ